MFEMIRRTLYGDMSMEDFKKFGMLSSVLLFIIGSYWLIRTLKDAIFMKTVGKLYIPTAKMLSFALLVPLILLYSELVDLVEKHKLFYIICGFYFFVFAGISIALAHPTIGLANTVTDKYRFVGWVSYLAIETFGSLVVALFWSFVASSTDTASAKKGYALIIGGAQIGSIAGPLLVTYAASSFGIPVLFGIATGAIFLVPLLINRFVTKYPVAVAEKKASKKTGPIEGLKLLVSKPYLLGILGIATLYEVIGTIMDYQMKYLADEAYGSADKVAAFLGTFGTATNGLALVFAFLGTSFFIRRYGLTFCLVMFPAAVACVVIYVMAYPILWAAFVAMVAIKGLSYALNNPCKEIMYIPTSKDVKFKAKGWIDMFGGRSAKAAGSVLNNQFAHSISHLMFYGSIVSLGIIGVWIMVALYIGRTNKALVDSGKIIE